jgi:hypothetical protein
MAGAILETFAKTPANADLDKSASLPTVNPDQSHPLTAQQVQVATYIAQMSSEMVAMSRTSGLELLAYFLDMARIEALTQARRNK